jgi:hypothetical protein
MGMPIPQDLEEYESLTVPVEAVLAWHCWNWCRGVQALDGMDKNLLDLSKDFCSLHRVPWEIHLINFVLIIHQVFTQVARGEDKEGGEDGDGISKARAGTGNEEVS